MYSSACFADILQAAGVAEEIRRHWAAAGLVLIEGATGPNSDFVNGRFEVAERPNKEPPIYSRADGKDGWLYVDKNGRWAVGDKKHKAECKTGTLTGGSCWAYSLKAAQGRLPEVVGTAWWVLHIGKQQLRVLPGEEAEVVVAEVYV